MSRKKHIDDFFRDIFKAQGPVVTDLDEALFLKNINAFNKEKRRLGFFRIFFILIGTTILAVSGFYFWNHIQTKPSVNQVSYHEAAVDRTEIPAQNEPTAVHEQPFPPTAKSVENKVGF